MPTERLSLEAAAARLGISIHTARRRVKAGTLQSEREQTASGYRWVVILDGDEPRLTTASPDTEPENGALLTQVISERDHLRSLVSSQQETIERLTVLLQEAHKRIEVPASSLVLPGEQAGNQPVTVDTQPATRTATQPVKRSRAPWWERLITALLPER